MRGAVAVLVVAVMAGLLAGCAGADETPQAPADFTELDLKAGTGKGVIRGVAVDDSIRPIAGVAITLGSGTLATTTDEEGRFGFSDVEPGLHFVKASKPGYGETQSSVEVVADEAEPKAVLIALTRVPGTDPLVVLMEWNGFMQCSFTIAIAFGTGCLLGDFTDDDSRRFDAIDSTPTALQSELVWKPTQALGTNLCMRHYASEDIGGPVLMGDVCGPSPLVQQASGERLGETEVGAGNGIERVVWVDDFAVDTTAGVAVNQAFDVYTALFYNIVPDPEWRFVDDGPYPV